MPTETMITWAVVMLGAMVLLFSIPLLLGYSRSFRHPRAASLVTGAVSGALQSSTSMGSPPVVLLMANQGIPKESFRGMLVLRSMAASLLSVVALVPSGLVDATVAAHALLMAPALLIGFAAGSRLLRLVPQRLFKRLTILLVAATALASLASSLL
ncbi:MAG: TSUP family transporter [Chloroflexota bacterium]